MQVLGLDNLLLAMVDLDAARYFYGELLGLPVKFEFAEAGLVAYQLGDGEPALILRQAEGGVALPNDRTARMWLQVPDARAAAAELQAAGVVLLSEPQQIRTGWLVEFPDPSGNVVGLTDYTNG